MQMERGKSYYQYQTNPETSCSLDNSWDNSSQNSYNTANDYNELPVSKRNYFPKIQNMGDSSVNSAVSENSSSNNVEIGETSSLPNIGVPQGGDKLRKRLRYHFMNPFDKWKIKRKFPWKLTLQIVKIVFVTIQLCYFGYHSYKYVKEHDDVTVTLRHILLKNWDSASDVIAYPPSSGLYAIYTREEFYQNMEFIISNYANLTNIAIGSFGYDSSNGTLAPLLFCKTYFQRGKIAVFNGTITFDNTPMNRCVSIPPIYPANDERWNNFSMKQFLKDKNMTINFDRLISSELKFSIKAVFLKSLSKLESPDCFRLNLTILYDNSQHDGQIVVALSSLSEKLRCHANVLYQDDDDDFNYIFRQVLNIVVIMLCVVSVILCGRSLYRGQILRRKAVTFFNKEFGISLSCQDQLEFVDFWFVMIVLNDMLIIAGSIVKIQIENRTIENNLYSSCSIMLGLGNLLAWAGVLRYLGFFHKYNILILTLKQALPNVMRFMLCALILYGGFCFCGWVVLGPYHIKFKHLSTTSECLFSLMNGDDMFATFAILNTNSDLIWYFSRAYLYLFICLFIYVVISLFISVIMDTYETIKEYYIHGTLPQTEMQRFIAECPDDASICDHRSKSPKSIFTWFKNCQKRNNYNTF